MLSRRVKGLKSPAAPGEGRGVYGKADVDREFVKLADPWLIRQPLPNLHLHGR